MLTDAEQRAAAKKFAAEWAGRGYEKGDTQLFWISLLSHVFGVQDTDSYIRFEDRVHLEHESFIDVRIPAAKVLIEQKSLNKDLSKPIRQSDGSLLTPFQQAKRYIANLPLSAHPRYVITCNFAEFWIYDMEQPNGEPAVVKLADLPKEYYRLSFIAAPENAHIKKEMEVSIQAGNLVGKMYDALRAQYIDPDSDDTMKSLNVLCVRLVFCLYAEDAGLFGGHAMFHDYLTSFRPENVRRALMDLFKVLDQRPEDRDPYMDDKLAAFPYVNGGLFADENIEIPRITAEIVELLVSECSEGFDWTDISPTIFGAVFESTLNPETRRSGGMHYTGIENIHKVIDPLFLDDLRNEFRSICGIKVKKTRNTRLRAFQDKLAGLSFLDPACGSGNFLTETYLSLRRIENEIISMLNDGSMVLGELDNPIKVSISQFYGIEINDFAVTVAKTALWIAESQMMKETEAIVHMQLDFLPLTTNAFIHEGNALRINWRDVLTPDNNVYIMGNPPFVGARQMKAGSTQKEDVARVFAGWKNFGNLDYVCCWYKVAADYMDGRPAIRAAFVSTNSVAQGDSVATLWEPLFKDGIKIHFTHRTFVWDSESNSKAHVHCVIIGFGYGNEAHPRVFNGGQPEYVSHINAYLIEADDIFVVSRSTPLCNVPPIGMGNQPIDDGNYLFTAEEKDEFIKQEPKSAAYFKPWYGAQEFIHRKPRYCLWLGECQPSELKKMKHCMERVTAVRDYRKKSRRASTKKLADYPTHFQTENMPKGHYIVIPEVSSERRRYVPMGYMDDSSLCSNKLRLMPDADLYHFGVLESNVHMAWMRVVCGRLKSDYDYSIKIVYNNFPWPTPTDAQKAAISKTAQGILDAREKYPNSSLADLYDEVTMPPELRKAHQENDKAVMTAYGFDWRHMAESDCVAELMKMYQKLIEV